MITPFLLDRLAGTLCGVPCSFLRHWVALVREDGDEVFGDPYRRVSCVLKKEADGWLVNVEEVRFPIAQEEWGRLTHFALFDSSSGGNQTWFDSLERPEEIGPMNQYYFPPGKLRIRLRQEELK